MIDATQTGKKSTPRCLALDLGASSGRLIELELKDDAFTMRELIRMKNSPKRDGDSLFWQHEHLFAEVVKGLYLAGVSGKTYDSIGVDAWGVDYVLLDKKGRLLGNPVAYRDKRTRGMIQRFTHEKISRKRVYEKTGIQFLEFNTLYQLYAQTLTEPGLLTGVHHLLFTSDYFHFLLSGVTRIEKTMASTSQMINLRDNCWDPDLLATLDLPGEALQPPVDPGTEIGALSPELCKKTGLSNLRVITPASHDTASAILAVPAEANDWAFLSSGTWSLLGVETKTPITGPDALASNWTNEGGYDNRYRFLKNINGLWIIQEIVRILGGRHTFTDLAAMAENEPGFVFLIDPGDLRFFSPVNMVNEIKEFCLETGQSVPETPGALARCAYDSLGLLYRKTFEELCSLSGKVIEVLHVVGGGSQANLLNQLTASATGIPVLAGPVEATALGNGLAQFLAAGAISTLGEARALVGRTFPPRRFEPVPTPGIDEAYRRFLALNPQTTQTEFR